MNLVESFYKTVGKTFILYALAGGMGALIDWGIFYILFYKFSFSAVMAAIIAFLISAMFNFALCKIIFVSKGRKISTEFILVIVASIIALIVDVSTMTFLIKWLDFNVMLAKIAGTGVGFLINYGFRQFFIFASPAATGNKIVKITPTGK